VSDRKSFQQLNIYKILFFLLVALILGFQNMAEFSKNRSVPPPKLTSQICLTSRFLTSQFSCRKQNDLFLKINFAEIFIRAFSCTEKYCTKFSENIVDKKYLKPFLGGARFSQKPVSDRKSFQQLNSYKILFFLLVALILGFQNMAEFSRNRSVPPPL
jgi:hypothetical protein